VRDHNVIGERARRRAGLIRLGVHSRSNPRFVRCFSRVFLETPPGSLMRRRLRHYHLHNECPDRVAGCYLRFRDGLCEWPVKSAEEREREREGQALQ